MLVNEFLPKSADRYPQKQALVCGEQRPNFVEMEVWSNSLGNALAEEGLQRYDRAAIYLDNSIEAIVSVFGILKSGGIFLVINPQVKDRKIEYIFNDCQVKVLITDSFHLSNIQKAISHCLSLELIILVDSEIPDRQEQALHDFRMESYHTILEQCSQEAPAKKCIDIDPASLIYTSGTTGNPKGVLLTHLNIVSATTSIIEYLENTSDDVILTVLPISYSYGLDQAIMSLRFGGTTILDQGFVYPVQTLNLIKKERVTGWPIVPPIASILLQMKDLSRFDVSSLRYITNAAQGMPPKHIKRLIEIFPKVKFFAMYGLTECKRVSYLPPQQLDKRPASVGKAIPNSETYLVDENDQRITSAGKPGELVFRGANVMSGYWNLPEATAAALRPGPFPGEKVLYTGDIFEMDDEGYLYFLGRKDGIIKTSGEKVSPKEVEDILCEMDGIAEAAVIGIDDEILGQAIKAFLIPSNGSMIRDEDVIRFCSRNMENHMIPKQVAFLKELPKTASGKVRKEDLK